MASLDCQIVSWLLTDETGSRAREPRAHGIAIVLLAGNIIAPRPDAPRDTDRSLALS
jgi:hypothetical protein